MLGSGAVWLETGEALTTEPRSDSDRVEPSESQETEIHNYTELA